MYFVHAYTWIVAHYRHWLAHNMLALLRAFRYLVLRTIVIKGKREGERVGRTSHSYENI